MSSKPNKRVFIYCRVSTGLQDLSLEVQLEKCHDYAKCYNFEVVETFSDTVTAKNSDRPDFIKLLDRLEKDKENIDGVLVAKMDRFTRSVSDSNDIVNKYFKERYSLYAVLENLDTKSVSGRLCLNIMSSVAQSERENISQRTKSVMQKKKEKGEKTGGRTPFGFEAYDSGEKNGKGRPILKLRESEYDMVTLQLIKDYRLQGMSLPEISSKLKDLKRETKIGKSKYDEKYMWYVSTIHKICKRYDIVKPKKENKEEEKEIILD